MKKIAIISLVTIALQTKAQLQVQPSGNVGIGTQTPNYRLQVLCNSGTTDGLLVSNNQSPSFAAFIRGNANNSTASTPDYTWYGDNGTGFFHPAAWQIGVGIGGTQKFAFNWDGCFYINTTSNSDGEKLSVTNAGTTNGTPVMTNIHTSSGTYNYAQKFYVDNNYTKALAVEFGTPSSYTDKFYVLGSGAVWANGSWLSSDRTLKEDITPITKALDKVLKLEGVTYKFKNEKGLSAANGREMGLIAQDVEKIIPEVVATNDKGMKAVAYSNLIGVLVEAIKEQHKIITGQQSKMDSLQDMVSQINNQVNTCCQSISGAGVSSKGTSTSINTNASVLYQNVPNPFVDNTEITYTIVAGAQKAALYIFDMQGKLLKSFDNLKSGTSKLLINGGDLKPAMYMYSLVVDGKEIDTKRMILTE